MASGSNSSTEWRGSGIVVGRQVMGPRAGMTGSVGVDTLEYGSLEFS
jgi:hypothetical protein